VTGTVEDASEVTVSVNGVEASVTGTDWSADDVPLGEGTNIITAVAVDQNGNVGTAVIELMVDSMPPIVTIETPPAGVVLGAVETDVGGLVNDIVPGTTIQEDDVTVVVNGVQAVVSNRAWSVPGLLLQPGLNTITAIATDVAGNVDTAVTEIEVDPQAGQRIVMVSGNAQNGDPGDILPFPLTVALIDDNGDPLVGYDVTFRVIRGDGKVVAIPLEDTTIVVKSDDDGLASVSYKLGGHSGAGNQRVLATATGFVGFVEFTAENFTKPPVRVTAESGIDQTGLVNTQIALPLKVIVTDDEGNPVRDVELEYAVVSGGGTLDGASTFATTSNSDGQAEAHLTLGPNPGVNNNVVEVSFEGLTEGPAVFRASSKLPGAATNTSISGVVLTNQDEPIPGVTITLQTGPMQTTSDANGNFKFDNAPIGTVEMVVDGSTATLDGVYPSVAYELHTVQGQDNTVGLPIYLPRLTESSNAAKLAGGLIDVTLLLDGVPGAELTVFANSLTCPDGSSECVVSVSQVNTERVPMPAPMGTTFNIAWTIQPIGATFDPPARICVPNTYLNPGEQSQTFSFDHDLQTWVAIGTATVTEDGKQLCSDPGFGVVKAGWHGAPPPPPPKKCVGSCDDGNPCTSDSCDNGSCKHTPTSGGGCTDDGDPCTDDKCQSGSCTHPPKAEGASCNGDGQECTEGKCMGGTCVETNKPNYTPCSDGPSDKSPECNTFECLNGACHPFYSDFEGQDCGDPAKCQSKCEQGQCKSPNEGGPCDDEKFCTEDDKCTNGECKGEEVKYDSSSTWEFDVKQYFSLILDPIEQVASVAPGCAVSFKNAGSTSGKSDWEAKLEWETTYECCEDKQILESEINKVSGSMGFALSFKCILAGIPVPSWAKKYLTAGIYIELKAGISGGWSGEINECDPSKDKFCLNASISGSVAISAEIVFIDDDLLSGTVKGTASASVSGSCCTGEGNSEIKANIGKLELEISFKFFFQLVTYAWKYTIWNGISGSYPFTCPVFN
jgi:hypothetical protein